MVGLCLKRGEGMSEGEVPLEMWEGVAIQNLIFYSNYDFNEGK